jgi:nucleotide-binding universal stress UspA family protein
MIRTIMVPLDGSRFAEWALPRAVAIARAAAAKLELVAVHVPAALSPTPDGSGFDLGWDRSMTRSITDYLVSLRSRISRESGVECGTSVRSGGVREMLLDHAEEVEPDLIAMTTHGRGPLQRMWLGSVADAMVRHARHPVLLVRPQEDEVPDPGAGVLFQRLLVPLDGSARSEAVLPLALELGDLGEAAFDFVRVVILPFAPATPYGVFASLGPEDRIAQRSRTAHRHVETCVLIAPDVANSIVAEAARRNADLIALSTHGRGPVGRAMLGSVADKIVRSSPTAVLLHRPEKE